MCLQKRIVIINLIYAVNENVMTNEQSNEIKTIYIHTYIHMLTAKNMHPYTFKYFYQRLQFKSNTFTFIFAYTI